MFLIEALKRLFTELTPEEEIEQEWQDIREIIYYPIYDFDPKKAASLIRECHPDLWYNHTKEIEEMINEAAEVYG